jgi:phage N-6-adenine-methyltransferase
MSPALLSSKRMNWETPWPVLRAVERILGVRFTLDVCAGTPGCAKAPAWLTPEQDGLAQEWPGWAWCNPPYGREQVRWVERASAESRHGYSDGVVCLLPARTDTRLFHRVIAPVAEVILLEGRIEFELSGQSCGTAPFPSMLAVFSKYRRAGIWIAKLSVTGDKVARKSGAGRTEVAG